MKTGILIVLLLTLGCQSASVIVPAPTTEEDKPIILPNSTCASSLTLDSQVTQREGRVGYREDLNLYYINVFLGGIDTSLTGLVCNMPDELKTVNQKVIFDGDYYTDVKLPSPRLGGESIRYLVLKSVKKN
ncbi:hypothetical protein GCM10028818_00310 [Spirosoma horti]